MPDFNEKVVLVLGATSGIGRDTAFAKAGASVALVGRRESEGKGATETTNSAGGKAILLRVDLTTGEQAIADVVTRTVAAYGRLDVASNNAGTDKFGPITDATESDWDAVLNLNLKSAWLACKRCGWEVDDPHPAKHIGPVMEIC